MDAVKSAQFWNLERTTDLYDYLSRANIEDDRRDELMRDIASATRTGTSLLPANPREISYTKSEVFSKEVELGRKTLYATPEFITRWRDAGAWNFSLYINDNFWLFNGGKQVVRGTKTNTMFDKWVEDMN
jgi:hypothetical protein